MKKKNFRYIRFIVNNCWELDLHFKVFCVIIWNILKEIIIKGEK